MTAVTQWRQRAVTVDMITWDGSYEALGVIRRHERAPAGYAAELRADGSLDIYVSKAGKIMNVERGDWVAFDRDGKGIHTVTAGEHADLYEPASCPLNGYNPHLRQLKRKRLDVLVGKFRAAFPHQGLPTAHGLVSRDKILSALLDFAEGTGEAR